MKKIVLSLVVTFFSIGAFAQGPWAQGKGHGYGQFLFNVVPKYNQIYNGGGNTRVAERSISDITLALYSEIGLSKKLTASFNLPFILVNTGSASDGVTPTLPSGSLSGLGNPTLSLKYTFLNNGLVAAFVGQVDLPLSKRDNETGLSTGVDALTIMPKVTFGGSKGQWFAYGFFGYGYRSNDYHDVLNFGAEGGYKVSENASLILNIHRLHNLNNGNASVDSPANILTGLYTSFQEYNGVILKFFIEDIYDGFGGFFSVGGGSGTSVAASPALSLGIFRKW